MPRWLERESPVFIILGHCLSQVMEEPNRRLELRFRPDDVFCKPACGERSPASSLLLR